MIIIAISNYVNITFINTLFAGNGDYSPSVSKRRARETVITISKILAVVSGKLRLQSQNISYGNEYY